VGAESSKIQAWTLNPVKFVEEVFDLDGSPGKVISEQQREGLECYRRIIVAKLKSSRKIPMTVQEAQDAKRLGLCIHSGHGTGKTAFMAWCILHFLTCRPYCKIPCVAPVGPQLKSNLWPEVHLWIRRSPFLQDLIKWQAEKIFFKEEAGREWFAFPRTVNAKSGAEEQAVTLAGIHADNMLVCVDESSGVPDPVFKPLEGGLTGPLNLVIQIGNPTQSHGFFNDSFTKNRQDWLVCHWNAEESELVEKSHVERMARKYGRDSNAYRIRVLGLPPTASPDTLIPYDWVMQAIGRELIVEPEMPVVLGVDVARYGDDKSIILRRKGPIVQALSEFTQLDSRQLASWALGEIQEHDVSCAAIDVIGWGAGTYDILNEMSPCPVLPCNVAEAAGDAEQFSRLRDELWWQVRERFQAGAISLPHDDELIDELTVIKYNFSKTAKEKIKIESKQDLRDRGVASPNKADALCLSEYAVRFVGARTRQTPKKWRQATSAWVG